MKNLTHALEARRLGGGRPAAGEQHAPLQRIVPGKAQHGTAECNLLRLLQRWFSLIPPAVRRVGTKVFTPRSKARSSVNSELPSSLLSLFDQLVHHLMDSPPREIEKTSRIETFFSYGTVPYVFCRVYVLYLYSRSVHTDSFFEAV